MILLLSIGFGLGVLATVLAAEYERKRRYPTTSAHSNVVGYGNWSAAYLCSDNLTREPFGSVTLTAQDSTFK